MKLTHTTNKEWGSKARKDQEALRGLTHTDARRAIQEQYDDLFGDPYAGTETYRGDDW